MIETARAQRWTSRHRRGSGWWLAMAILAALLAALQYQLWFGDGGLPRVWELRAGVEAQKEDNRQLHARNVELAAEVRDLETGTEAIEYRARHDLGMIREGETFYLIDSR